MARTVILPNTPAPSAGSLMVSLGGGTTSPALHADPLVAGIVADHGAVADPVAVRGWS